MSTSTQHKIGPESPGLLTTLETAARLAVSKRHLQQLVSERRICAVKVGRSVRFDPADVEGFIEANKVRAVGWKARRDGKTNKGDHDL